MKDVTFSYHQYNSVVILPHIVGYERDNEGIVDDYLQPDRHHRRIFAALFKCELVTVADCL